MAVTFFAMCLPASESMAVKMSKDNQPAIRAAINSAFIQNASGDDTRRRAYEIAYRQPVYANVFSEIELNFANDNKNRSGSLNVTQDFINTFLFIGASYPKLFRFHFSLGPSYYQSTTTYDYLGDTEEFDSQETGWAYRIGADYAFEHCCEITISMTTHNRTATSKQDTFYGLGFQFNIPAGYQTKSLTF